MTRLQLGLSHLRYHKFKHNFLDTMDTLLSKTFEIISDLITRNDLALIETLLFGYNSFSQYDNSIILDGTIAFIVTSKRFDDPLLV